MKVTSAKEFIWYYNNNKEIPTFDVENEADEILLNTLMQIHLDIMEDNHYVPLVKVIIEKHSDLLDGFIPVENLAKHSQKAINKLINLAIETEMSLTDEMMMYYVAKTCEELGVGDMGAGAKLDDDWYIYHTYKNLTTKAKLFNLYYYNVDQQIEMLEADLDKAIKKRDRLNNEINAMVIQRLKLRNESKTLSTKSGT